MKKIKTYIVDAFTNEAFSGNPAGVVPNAEGLNESQMQKIANELNCSETAFVKKISGEADYEVRFFTPTNEVDLCGHATIATFYTLAEEGYLSDFDKINQQIELTQKTKAGNLKVKVIFDKKGRVEKVIMAQGKPQFDMSIRDVETIASILNIDKDDIACEKWPLGKASTGLYDLMIPVTSKEVLDKINPDMVAMTDYQNLHDVVSFHVYTMEGQKVYTRDFAPSVGIDEESATGTANGALISLLVHHDILDGTLIDDVRKLKKIVNHVNQGYILNRPSIITVEIIYSQKNIHEVFVGGQACIVFKGEMLWRTINEDI